MTSRGRRHDVQVVDEHGATDASAPVPSTRRRRRWAVPAAVTVTVAVVAVVGQTVVDRQERARLAALTALPGVVSALPGPPDMLWESADDTVLATQVRTADGLLVGVSAQLVGAVQVVAVEAATGLVAWESVLLDADARQEPTENLISAVPGACAADPGDPRRVVCLAGDGLWSAADGALRQLPPTTLRLVVVDTRDGTVVTDLTDALPGPGRTSFAIVDDLVVVGRAQGDEVDVRALTTDGTTRWRTTLPGPVDEDLATFVAPVEDLVAVTTRTTVRLLDATGATVRDVPRPDGRSALRGAGGDAVDPSAALHRVLSYDLLLGDQPSEPRTVVVVGADHDVEVVGDVVPFAVDDGSVPGLVLTADGRDLRAWDGDGDELWSVEIPAGEGVLLLDGRVHLDGGTRLVTLDARTGAELWRTAATVERPVTDGRLLLGNAAVPSPGVQTELVALDTRDGSEVWRAPLPDSATLVAHHHLLLAVWFELPTDEDPGGRVRATALG